MGVSAVFALCVRSSGTHLPRVLKNLERLARLYDRSGFVFIEGDSIDDSKAILKAWVAERAQATVIELDGLDASHPKRTDRLAFCRNAYIDFIRASSLVAFDQLVGHGGGVRQLPAVLL